MAPMELNDVTLKGPPRLIKRTRWIVNCPGMMQGYEMNNTGYVEYKSMPPACLGYVKVEMYFSSRIPGIALDEKPMTGIRLQPMIVSPHEFGG